MRTWLVIFRGKLQSSNRANQRNPRLTNGPQWWKKWYLPSGYVKIAIENGHRNSELSHYIKVVIFHSCVSLPEGRLFNHPILQTKKKHIQPPSCIRSVSANLFLPGTRQGFPSGFRATNFAVTGRLRRARSTISIYHILLGRMMRSSGFVISTWSQQIDQAVFYLATFFLLGDQCQSADCSLELLRLVDRNTATWSLSMSLWSSPAAASSFQRHRLVAGWW